MVKKLLLNLTILFCFNFVALAQNTYNISGIVKDNKETLPGAAIYVSGYKIATVTNNDGNFILPKLPVGSYDILVQMIGYLPYSKNIVISDQSVNITVLLIENTTTLNEVVIKPDPDRLFHLAFFKDNFIGTTVNARNCKIINTQVLNFDDSRTNRLLTASANDFLIIENKSLGYRIRYLLEYFQYDYNTGIVFYAGYPHYEEMQGSKSKQRTWAKNREIAYSGSTQHFFKSLYQNTITQEGFVINKLKEIPNPIRRPDSIITANIKRLLPKSGGRIVIGNNDNDSLSYWLKQRKEPKTIDAYSSALVLTDTLVKTDDSELKTINFNDKLFISYKNEKESGPYMSSGRRQNRPPGFENFQISVVRQLSPRTRFYKNGGIEDPKSLLYSGYWAYEKMADFVPLDYISLKEKP